MSVGFNPKSELALTQELRVQELSVSGKDTQLYSFVAGTPIVSSDPFIGVAGGYGILAATAITNSVGTSIVNGNLGESPGSTVTGSFTVSGSTDLANAASLAAQNAALSGYTTLAALGGYVTIPSALDGQTLTAGRYQFASGAATLAASAPGTLTLSGSATDVFVIKTASTLGTGAGGMPTIALTGGALAKNVYWVIGSSATINIGVTSAGGVFNGNVIANTSVTVTQSSTINGSLIALNAAITVSNISTINAVSGSTSSPSINISVLIREPILKIFMGQIKTDASNSMYNFDQAHMSIIDSNNALSGFNEDGVKVSDRNFILLSQYPGSSFPVNDLIVVKYAAQKHL